MRSKQGYVQRQKKIRIFQAAVFAALFALVWIMTREKQYRDIDISEVAVSLLICTEETLVRGDALLLKRNFGLNANQYEAVIYFGPDSNMDAAELLLLKLSDREQQTEEVQEALQERIAYQRTCFEGYGEEQIALLDTAQIVCRGQYILFVVSEKAEDIKNEFLKQIAP